MPLTQCDAGHALMLTLVGSLRALADDFSLAVLLTNHTAGGRDGAVGSLKPALGETWKSQRAQRDAVCKPATHAHRA